MNRWGKLGIVLAGYLLAVVASVVAVAIYDRRFTAADNQTMGGMIAGGEMIYGAGVFFFFSLAPTGLALWFLRRSRASWSWFSSGCLAFAALGLVAALTILFVRGTTTRGPWLMVAELLGLAQMLGSPLWIAGFVLFALLAPYRDLRRRMFAALAIEVVIGACGLVYFLVTAPPI